MCLVSVVVNVLRCTMRVTEAPSVYFPIETAKKNTQAKKIVEYGASHNNQLTTRTLDLLLDSCFFFWLKIDYDFCVVAVVVVGGDVRRCGRADDHTAIEK